MTWYEMTMSMKQIIRARQSCELDMEMDGKGMTMGICMYVEGHRLMTVVQHDPLWM